MTWWGIAWCAAGPKYSEPQRITAEMVEELRGPFDPEHLPEEILLVEAFHPAFRPATSGVFRHFPP